MSSFGAKRKARIIKVDDNDDESRESSDSLTESGSSNQEPVKPVFGTKSGRKPFRQSGLRKAFNSSDGDGNKDALPKDGGGDDDNEDGATVVIRPNVVRPGSVKQKKRIPTSKFSFSGDTVGADDDLEETKEVSAVKKAPLGPKGVANGTLRRGLAARGLAFPVRTPQDEDDRPKYSKEYLHELQSSTPNTPRDLSSLGIDDADEMDLDPSELEGALIVDSPAPPLGAQSTTKILTDAEIREKKERRARLAKEQNFLSVDDDEENEKDDDDDTSLRKKKNETRLVAEDEDLGEGFDDYVEDGGLSLGKRAQKERRKQDRRRMAELINDAEGHTSDGSSDESDAERRMAYESAQTRAGLDGLKKPSRDPSEQLLQVPPKITPLPNLTECLSQLQLTLRAMEAELESKAASVAALAQEKRDIEKREAEVQALLDETGRKYQEAMGRKDVPVETLAHGAANIELAGERGLESLGATPARRDEDVT